MPTGTVKTSNDHKEFYFAVPDDGGGDVYVDRREVLVAGLDTLERGQRLAFERAADVRRAGTFQAIKIKLLRATASAGGR